MSANFADDLSTCIQIGDEVAVGNVHDVDFFCADDICRGALFFMADGAQLVRCQVWVGGGVETFIAAGQQDVVDVMSLVCPFGKCSTAEEFRVVGVGENDENV